MLASEPDLCNPPARWDVQHEKCSCGSYTVGGSHAMDNGLLTVDYALGFGSPPE